MRTRAAIVAAAALCLSSAALAEGDQAYLGVFAETYANKMVGMPAMTMPNLPPGVKLPPAVLAMMSGKPTRKLTVRLWSPGIAADNAFATLAVPDGLKQGPKLDLQLYRPKEETGTTTPGTGPNDGQPVDMQFTIKRYWGSSATVRDGQPEVIEFKGLTPDQQRQMREQSRRAQAGSTYFYKPDWTTGYWPTDKQPGQIEDDAALVGHYALATNYTGNVEIDVPSNVNFLDGFTISKPDLAKQIDFGQPITFNWKQIPNLLGIYAQVVGMQQSKKTMIIWSCSWNKPEIGMQWDYLQMAEVRDLVSRKQMLPGDTVEMTVPIGIFKDCDFVSGMMIGYGPGTALDKAQPLPRVQTKTTLTMMLGGTQMRNMGGNRGGRPGNVTPDEPAEGDQ